MTELREELLRRKKRVVADFRLSGGVLRARFAHLATFAPDKFATELLAAASSASARRGNGLVDYNALDLPSEMAQLAIAVDFTSGRHRNRPAGRQSSCNISGDKAMKMTVTTLNGASAVVQWHAHEQLWQVLPRVEAQLPSLKKSGCTSTLGFGDSEILDLSMSLACLPPDMLALGEMMVSLVTHASGASWGWRTLSACQATAATESFAYAQEGGWDDAAKKHYDEGRRTVEFAISAANAREARLAALVVDGSGICTGSRPRATSDPIPDASWNSCE